MGKKTKLKNLFLEFSRRQEAVRQKDARLEEIIAQTPDGNGEPIFMLPGFTLSDASFETIRSFLERKGYNVYGWEQGRNLGPAEHKLNSVEQRLHKISLEHGGQRVAVIGYSLGGLYARELARKYPDIVSQAITIASPFAVDEESAVSLEPMARLSEIFDESARGISASELVARSLSPLSVPTTAVYSKLDGIVHWQDAMCIPTEQSENIEARTSHLGLLVSPAVLLVLADRLAQTPDEWRPFDLSDYPNQRDLFPGCAEPLMPRR